MVYKSFRGREYQYLYHFCESFSIKNGNARLTYVIKSLLIGLNKHVFKLIKEDINTNFVNFIENLGNKSGWRISQVYSDSLVKFTFDTNYGTEDVFVKPCGKDANNNTVLEFSSSGLELFENTSENGFMALYFLRRSGEMLMGNWGIENINGKEYFTVFNTQIAQTMDLDEFQASIRAILNEKANLQKDIQKNTIDF